MGADGTASIDVVVSTLADGILSVVTTETDVLGNHATAPRDSWTKDTTGPSATVALDVPAAGGVSYDIGAGIALTWSVADANGVGTVSATIGAQTIVANGGLIDTVMLLAGLNTVVLSATDLAGNVTTVSIAFTVKVTTTGLKAGLLAGIARGWVPGGASYQATLTSQAQAVVDNAGKPGSGNTAAVRLRTFISTVTSAKATQITTSFRTLLLNWATDLLSRL
jgi:hypothetical protein